MLNDASPYSDRSAANGSVTSFAYTFKILAAADIAVYVDTTLKSLGTHYTLAGVGDSGGGTVEFLSAPANNSIVTRLRNQASAQLSDYIPNEAFPWTRIEQDLDKLVAQVQQAKEQLRRGFFLPVSSSLADQGIDAPVVGSFARGKTGGGIDWATPTAAGPLSSPVAIADGGTGATNAADARTNLLLYNQNTLIDAKGDLLVGLSDNTLTRVAGGVTGDALTYDTAQTANVVWSPIYQRSYAPNPFFEVDQLANSATSVADDTYGHDHWYALTQTNTIELFTGLLQEDGQATNARLLQSQVAAQRMGYACILEASEAQKLRGKTMVFKPRLRLSTTATVRYAVLEWTGTADAVTSDVVNDWTSTNYTVGNFFVATTTNVLGVSVKSLSAATWDDAAGVSVTIGSSCNNIILFIWTENAAARFVTLDIGTVRFMIGAYKGPIALPTFAETLRYAHRFYQKSFLYATAPAQNAGLGTGEYRWLATLAGANAHMSPNWPFPTVMHSNGPSMTWWNPSSANGEVRDITDGTDMTSTATRVATYKTFQVQFTGAAGNAVGEELAVHWTANARL